MSSDQSNSQSSRSLSFTAEEKKELEIQISNLMVRHPDELAYLDLKGVGGFYPTKAAIKKKYNELIQIEAIALLDDMKSKQKERAIELEKKRVAEVLYNQEVADLILVLEGYPKDADYLSLAEEHRAVLEGLVGRIRRKNFSKWSENEKFIYRFWFKLDRVGLLQVEKSVEIEEKIESISEEKTPAEFLSQMRKQTEYPVLRFFIDIGCLLQLVACVCIGVNQLGKSPSGDAGLFYALVVLACVTVLIFVFVAIRQGGLLLIDIADILIEKGRRKFTR